jgi:hypothetical protein
MTWNNVVSNAPLGAPQDTNSVTVPFYTFMVSASLTNQIAPQIFNMSLRSTNVVLGTTNVLPTDVFNVVSNLFIDADNLTLLPSSYLYLTTVGNTWQDYAPYLKNFTNNGVLDDQKSINLTFISHNRATGVEQPYKSFVNTNRILCPGGDTIWSDYVENTGQINPTNGSVIIQSTTALLRSPGVITASNADISIITGTLNVTNHIVRAGRSISLSVTNALNAGTNVWSCGDGFNWFTTTAPGFTGDMLLTTITNNAFAYANVYNYWNAQDRGASAAGYTNNAALGKLVLVGGLNSAFTFAPVDGNNALYVDILDLRGTAGDTNASGAFVNLFVLPSMKVYFSRLQINGVSNNVALLSGQGQGGGLFTSVAHTPSLSSVGGSGGSASFANFNLVAELADASGPKLNANGSAPSTVLVSWDTVANANNTVYYKDSLADSDWHVLTNFVSTTAGRIVMGNANNTGTRFFRVQVDAPTP